MRKTILLFILIVISTFLYAIDELPLCRYQDNDFSLYMMNSEVMDLLSNPDRIEVIPFSNPEKSEYDTIVYRYNERFCFRFFRKGEWIYAIEINTDECELLCNEKAVRIGMSKSEIEEIMGYGILISKDNQISVYDYSYKDPKDPFETDSIQLFYENDMLVYILIAVPYCL